MTTLLLNALILHVLLGITGIVVFTGVALMLRGEKLSIGWLRINSLLGLLFFLGSWIAGGYYYTSYYGKAVKPAITGGSDAWVHTVLMESKEHAFLFLPFLAFVVFVLINSLSSELKINKKLKKSLILLCFVIVSLGLAITISGMAISGSVAKKPNAYLPTITLST